MNDRRLQPRSEEPGQSRLRQFAAWGVHFYTALGLVAAAVMGVFIVRGDAWAFAMAFAMMVAATLIDATDGLLARAVRIRQTLPGFDGRRLDDLVDFLTYAFLPLLLVWRAELLGPAEDWPRQAWLLAPLLASAYGFCQVNAKTDDGFFLGFPSYWNVVAFYLYVLRPPAGLAIAALASLAVLTFVPLRYLYPSQRGTLNQITSLLGIVWAVLLIWILTGLLQAANAARPHLDPQTTRLAWASLAFPGYYFVASWWISATGGFRRLLRR